MDPDWASKRETISVETNVSAPFLRLDHLVVEVPDIEVSHRHLLQHGFEEAWPVGRTWAFGRTSGIFLGGVNIELLQLDEGSRACFGLGAAGPKSSAAVLEPRLSIVVYRPSSVEEAVASYGARASVAKKVSDDSALLALRGFPAELREEPQTICTNVYVEGEERFFFCEYGPYLASRLDPSARRGPLGAVVEIAAPFELPAPTEGPAVRYGEAAVTFAERPSVPLRELVS